MNVSEGSGSEIVWTSHQPNGEVWFKGKFDLMDFEATKTSDPNIAQKLTQIFKAACRMNSEFLSKWKKYKVDTYLDFDRNWGFGSSSTLISCIAQWADVNPYQLLFNTLGGSGYDIACAQAEGPILYQLGEDQLHVEHVDFQPAFSHHLFLVYLGSKSDSAKARKLYYEHKAKSNGTLGHISEISTCLTETSDLATFEKCLVEHERLISKSLHIPTVQQERFPDFWGVVKSLGAWGGDFVLATSERPIEDVKAYFAEHDLKTVYTYNDLVLEQQVEA